MPGAHPPPAETVLLLLGAAQPDDVEQLAIDFCARGPGVRLAPHPAGRPLLPGPVRALALAPDAQVRHSGCWVLTDADGVPVQCSPRLVGAVYAGHPWVEVQLRDGSGAVLARGRVGTRRSVTATVHRTQRVAGPLTVAAVLGGPPLAPAPEAAASARRASIRAADTRGAARFAGRLARAAVTCREWAVARVDGVPGLPAALSRPGPTRRAVRFRAARRSAFWADPCAVTDDGEWLFVEELDRWTGRGSIRLLQVDGDEVTAGPICLATEHHLSFPQVYRTASGWLATVETCASVNPVRTFDRIGQPWRDAGVGLLPAHIGDPVLTLVDGRISGLVGSDAATDPDAVAVEYRRIDDTWVRDDTRVQVDVIRTRGGGTLDAGRSLRATQDCAGTYGRAIEVTAWPTTHPVARLDRCVAASMTGSRRWVGLHTLTWTPDASAAWIDGWRRRVTPLGGLWRLIERRHLSRCQG